MRILIAAGPTREHIDPVRFISNSSTGNMGFALANAAKKRQHKVTLISGPVNLKAPKNIKIIDVQSASDMFKAVKAEFKKIDCLFMPAAVCDYKPEKVLQHKLKKTTTKQIGLLLKKNPDILQWAGEHKTRQVIIGFCMETKDLKTSAWQKLNNKKVDLMVANKLKKDGKSFGNNPSSVLLLDKDSKIKKIGPKTKEQIAEILLDKAESLWRDSL